jgi:hypothetical protein
VFLLLTACTEVDDGRHGENAAASCDRTDTDVALDESTPLGFAAADVLAWLEADHATTLTLSGSDTDRNLVVAVTSDGTATWVDLEDAPSSGGIEPAIAAVCEDSLELGATVSFVTDDGSFAESWPLALAVARVDAATARLELDPGDIAGTFTPEAELVDGCDTATLAVDLAFDQAGGVSGSLAVRCARTDGDTASMSQDVVATWGDEGE